MRFVNGSSTKVLASSVLVLALALAACDTSESNQQIADLEQQVSSLEGELEQTQAALDDAEAESAELQQQLTDTQGELAATQDELASTDEKLASTEEELGTTQAELLDAQAQLARVGEVVLTDGTYIGPVLGAKASPYRVIVFNAAGLFRVGQVATDATITSGGSSRTLAQLGRLLASTNPDDAELANGNYQVIVRNGIVTSIRKSQR
jgi:TolA-binding protein